MGDTVEAVVIGAGVVGLAVARRLAMTGLEVIVLEAAEAIGTETSSRNSEVIHAGIYYPKDSWTAQFCVAGKKALYRYCETHGVEHRNCGKFIVATNKEQISELERLKRAATENGVPDLEWRTPTEVSVEEPAVFCVKALWSPSTGIIDSHGLMLSYQGDAEAAGAMIAFHAPVESGVIKDPTTVSPTTTIREVLELTRKLRISGVPVVDGEDLVGIVTNRDLRFETHFEDPVSTVMTATESLVTVREGAERREVLHLLHKHSLKIRFTK